MHVQILDAGDPRWVDALREIPHDFYSLPEYVTLASRFEGGTPIAILASDEGRRLLMPLLLRDIPAGLGGAGVRGRQDALSPYGYPGIGLASTPPAEPADATFLDTAMTAVIGALRERGVVSVFIRLNPLLPVDASALTRHGLVVDHGRTVSIDLLRDEKDLFRDLRRGHRKDLRRLNRLGYTCEMDDTCRPESIAAFVAVYTETMDRLSASGTYYFDAKYVQDLIAALRGRVTIAVTRSGDEVVAVGLFTECDGIVQDHLGGTRSAYLPFAPSKLETWEAAHWAKARGNRVLHLGGGLGGAEDALFDFKAGFSPDRHLFQTVRIVIDSLAYDALLESWSAVAGHSALDPRGFFPPYRAPLQVVAR